MQIEEYLKLMLGLLQHRIVNIGEQQGVSKEYIQRQLKEAHHQVEILGQKLLRSNKDGF